MKSELNSDSLLMLFFLFVCSCTAEPPPDFTPRVVTGQGFFDKTLVLSERRLGGITDIRLLPPQPGAPAVLVLAGTNGAAFLDPGTFEVVRFVPYEDSPRASWEHRILNADSAGPVGFLRVANASGEAALLDGDGHVLWSRSAPGKSFPHTTYGDLDGDGQIEVLLWRLNSETVELVDTQGESIWVGHWIPDRPGRMLCVDIDGDGCDEIAYIGDNALHIRDGEGRRVRRDVIQRASFVNTLDACRYPYPDGPVSLCVGYNISEGTKRRQLYRILGPEGRVLRDGLKASELPRYLALHRVRLDARRPPYAAGIEVMLFQGVPVGFSAIQLRLRVYESTGPLVYEEVIGSVEEERSFRYGSLHSLPIEEREEHGILVGWGRELWLYTRRSP